MLNQNGTFAFHLLIQLKHVFPQVDLQWLDYRSAFHAALIQSSLTMRFNWLPVAEYEVYWAHLDKACGPSEYLQVEMITLFLSQ